MSDQIITDLVDFGLSSLQARVYVAILKSDRRPVRQIAAQVGIARPEAYRILRELSSKGLVQRVPTSPSTYTATPPSQALPQLLTEFREELASLEQKNTRLVKSLASMTSVIEYAFEPRFSVIRGGANALDQAKRLITDAKSDYSGILSRHGLRRIREDGVGAALILAKKRGVRVRVITEVDSSNIECARFMSKYIEIRRTRNLPLYLDIMDKREMQMGPAITFEEEADHTEREMDVWTNNLRFIRGMYMLFEQLWHKCPKVEPISQ